MQQQGASKGGWEQELAELPALAEPWDAACWSQAGRGKHARATGVCAHSPVMGCRIQPLEPSLR